MAPALEGSLTATLQGTETDLRAQAVLLKILTRKAGRLIFNGFPTGVEVGSAMQHGGPYPSTRTRASPPSARAIVRFARPICYQDFPTEFLPAELRQQALQMSDNHFDSPDTSLYEVPASAPGPQGTLPLSEAMLRERPSGDLFGWTQNAGMGWEPAKLNAKEFLILSTHGGVRAADGTPIALGYHTGHWEVGLLVEAAANAFKEAGAIPFAGACTDPCDGRSQGTTGMFDSLPYRDDAATVFRRLIRSLPTRSGVLGVATCDKGLPAMMMALAAMHDLATILVPGGVTLPSQSGEDAGRVQRIGVRFVHRELTLEQASALGCRACGSPGGGCQFLGTAATSQVVGEALGLSIGHSALAPSGQPIWLDMARRSARALLILEARGLRTRDILTSASVHNAMVAHAAFGGSTNLILHIPAIAHAAGLPRPVAADWTRINRQVPRLVDALPNGPRHHPTVQVFLAGGVPEVMLHLRRAGLLETRALTVSGQTLGNQLDQWEASERRVNLRRLLRVREGVDPDQVILSPDQARRSGLTSTVCFAAGNLHPRARSSRVPRSTRASSTPMAFTAKLGLQRFS